MTDAEKLLRCATMTPGDAIETIAEDGSWWTLHNQRIKALVAAHDALARALAETEMELPHDVWRRMKAVLDQYAPGWGQPK